jgi:hypothetical protein
MSIFQTLTDSGIITSRAPVSDKFRNYVLQYRIPESDGKLQGQVELDRRFVESNFQRLYELKEMIFHALGYPEELRESLYACTDVIIQELEPGKILDWHIDAYKFDDGSSLSYEALFYVSTVNDPDRVFMWREKDAGYLAHSLKIKNGTVVLINCENDRFEHAAIAADKIGERTVTLLLGCRR